MTADRRSAPGEAAPGEPLSELNVAVAAYAGRLRAAGAPLAGALRAALAAAADGAALLPDDEYETLMTSVAAWVIEGYAQERDGAAVPVTPRLDAADLTRPH